MARARPSRPGRLLGLYALSMMAREGPVHGYQLAQRIAERTEGSWRPGAGAIYPALTRLTERGFASARLDGTRRIYTVTAKGRAMLRQLTEQVGGAGSTIPDTTVLWMEIVGEADQGRYLLRHLRTHLDQAIRYAEKVRRTPAGPEFRSEVAAEFERFDRRTRRRVPVARGDR